MSTYFLRPRTQAIWFCTIFVKLLFSTFRAGELMMNICLLSQGASPPRPLVLPCVEHEPCGTWYMNYDRSTYTYYDHSTCIMSWNALFREIRDEASGRLLGKQGGWGAPTGVSRQQKIWLVHFFKFVQHLETRLWYFRWTPRSRVGGVDWKLNYSSQKVELWAKTCSTPHAMMSHPPDHILASFPYHFETKKPN